MHSENRMAESLLQQLLMKLQMLYKQLTSTDRLLAKLGVARDDIEMKPEEVRRAAQPHCAAKLDWCAAACSNRASMLDSCQTGNEHLQWHTGNGCEST